MAKALTVRSIENLKAGTTRLEVPDGLVRGLYFILQPTGKASWAVRYRHQRQTRKVTLGTYPAIDLKNAREIASRTLVEVATGSDPASEKQAAKAGICQGDLFEGVVERFIERYARSNAPRSWQETKRLLDKEAVSAWRGRSIADIRRRDVHELLDAICDRGTPILANRVLAAVRRLFGWAVERDMLEASPCIGVKPPSAEKSRERVLSDAELSQVWSAAHGLGWPFGPLIKLLILTGARRSEVAEMRWCEIDVAASLWTIPRERAKNGIEHRIPLSATATSILSALPRVDGSDFVFSGTGRSPVSGFTKAKRRLDGALGENDGFQPWVLHDLRRTFATGCARAGVALPTIERLLNHVSGSFAGIVGVYQRHTYEEEKRVAIDLWDRRLSSIVNAHIST